MQYEQLKPLIEMHIEVECADFARDKDVDQARRSNRLNLFTVCAMHEKDHSPRLLLVPLDR